jgi:hypothetical protein
MKGNTRLDEMKQKLSEVQHKIWHEKALILKLSGVLSELVKQVDTDALAHGGPGYAMANHALESVRAAFCKGRRASVRLSKCLEEFALMEHFVNELEGTSKKLAKTFSEKIEKK